MVDLNNDLSDFKVEKDILVVIEIDSEKNIHEKVISRIHIFVTYF